MTLANELLFYFSETVVQTELLSSRTQVESLFTIYYQEGPVCFAVLCVLYMLTMINDNIYHGLHVQYVECRETHLPLFIVYIILLLYIFFKALSGTPPWVLQKTNWDESL